MSFLKVKIASDILANTKPTTRKISNSKLEYGSVEKVGKKTGGGSDSTKGYWQNYIGIILAISSSMIFALCVLLMKLLTRYHPFSLCLWLSNGMFVLSLPVALYYNCSNGELFRKMMSPPNHYRTIAFLMLRVTASVTAVIFQFYSLQYISIADSSVIAFSTPVFVSLASHILLGEKSGIIPMTCGLITLIGVIIISRPPVLTGESGFDSATLIGAGFAFASMFCAAANFLLLRHLRDVHFSIIAVSLGFWGILESLLLSTTINTFELPEKMDDWIFAIAQAVLTFIAQILLTLAFKYEQAGTVSLCRTCDIIFAFIWQFIFLDVIPDKFSLVGGGVVIFGVFIATIRKVLGDLPENNSVRKMFWVLLK